MCICVYIAIYIYIYIYIYIFVYVYIYIYINMKRIPIQDALCWKASSLISRRDGRFPDPRGLFPDPDSLFPDPNVGFPEPMADFRTPIVRFPGWSISRTRWSICRPQWSVVIDQKPTCVTPEVWRIFFRIDFHTLSNKWRPTEANSAWLVLSWPEGPWLHPIVPTRCGTREACAKKSSCHCHPARLWNAK